LNQIPSAEDVKRIRERLQVSVSQFASLVGVTRQTVHSWERTDRGGMTFGPAAILARLLDQDRSEHADEVYSELLALAKNRGELENVVPPPREGPRGGQQGMRPTLLPFPPNGAPTFCASGTGAA
jgi:DNA-binding XRE family transcriptional regulator